MDPAYGTRSMVRLIGEIRSAKWNRKEEIALAVALAEITRSVDLKLGREESLDMCFMGRVSFGFSRVYGV